MPPTKPTPRPVLRLLERRRLPQPQAASRPARPAAPAVAWWERLFFGVGDTGRR